MPTICVFILHVFILRVFILHVFILHVYILHVYILRVLVETKSAYVVTHCDSYVLIQLRHEIQWAFALLFYESDVSMIATIQLSLSLPTVATRCLR